MLAMEGASPRGDLLIIVLDCNPFWWGKSVASSTTPTDFGSFASTNASASANHEISDILSHCLNSVLALANAHLLFDADNEVAIIASYNNHTKFLSYQEPGSSSLPTPSTENTNGVDEASAPTSMTNGDANFIEENSNPVPDSEAATNLIGCRDGKHERLAQMNEQVNTGLKSFVEENAGSADLGVTNDSVVAGAMAMALCYINKIRKTSQPMACADVDDVDSQLPARILVIKGANDSSSQYLNFMNAVFTAQRQNVVVDSCVLGKVSSLLQQAADITGGICFKVPALAALTQYLMWVFLPRPSLRSKLSLPPSEDVDYRAACFCHRNLIDVGFVCSVCLSIFCAFSPICSTCQVVLEAVAVVIMTTKWMMMMIR